MDAEFIGKIIIGLGAIVSLFWAIGKPMLNLSNTLTKVGAELKWIVEDYKAYKDSHKKEHEEIKKEQSEMREDIQGNKDQLALQAHGIETLGRAVRREEKEI